MPRQRRKNGGEPPKTVSCKFSKKEQALMIKLFGLSDQSEIDAWKATKWWKAELEIIQDDITDAIVQCTGKKQTKYRQELMAVFNKIQQCIELHDMQKEMKLRASKKNPRRRKNGTDMKYEIKLTRTQHNALRNWFQGKAELSPMYHLWDKAKKKTKSARTLTFMAPEAFIDALLRELENSTRYTTRMNDRDFKALKSLRDQVKKLGMNDNPRKRTQQKGWRHQKRPTLPTVTVRGSKGAWYIVISETLGMFRGRGKKRFPETFIQHKRYKTKKEAQEVAADAYRQIEAYHIQTSGGYPDLQALTDRKVLNPKGKNAQSEAKRAMDMHHQEGISLKDAWAIVKGKKKPKRKNGTKKGEVRKTARRAYMKNPDKYTRKRGSHGRMMYFKNGKICSKETYTKKL